MKNKSYVVNLTCLIVSMMIFGTVGLFSRLLPYPSSVIALLRSAIGFIFIALFMLVLRRKPDICGALRNKFLLVLSGAMLGLNWIAFFEACRLTTVQTATLAYYLAPIILVCISPIFFKERLTPKKLGCIAAALLGMVFVSGVIDGGAEGITYEGIAFGVVAAIIYAAIIVCNKKMKDIEPLTKTAAQFVVSAVVLVPYVLLTGGFSGFSFQAGQIIPILIIGCVHTGFAYILYFGSSTGLPANTVAIYSYTDPIVALVASAIVIGESMTPLMIIGAVLIVGSSVVSEINFNIKRKECGECAADNESNED